MKLLVRRTDPSDACIIGELWIAGERFCYTMEPPERPKEIKPRAVPLGTYDVKIRWSGHWARLMPHVEGVPDFEEIEIHPGNFPKNSHGCLMVGETKAPMVHFIGDSKKAFDALFLKITEATDPITITYTEG